MLAITQRTIQENTPISDLVEFTEASYQKSQGILGKRPLKVGDVCHFAGVHWYAHKHHPRGFVGGYNVIYIGNDKEGAQLFLVHGLEKPFTEKEINQRLIERYNQERNLQSEAAYS